MIDFYKRIVQLSPKKRTLLALQLNKQLPSQALEDIPSAKRLVAYLVSSQGQVLTSSELRRFLMEKLPEYMIPSAFVHLDALPLMSNGKVNRRALPAPEVARPDLEGTFVAPRTSVEEVVAGLWAKVLGLEQVGIHDNFFELGGHSLLATQVIFRVRDTFQVDLPLRSLFEAPTVAELSLAMLAHEAKPGQTEKIAQVLKQIEAMSAEDIKETLQNRKRERVKP